MTITEEIGIRLRKLRESKLDENGRRYSQGKLIEEFDKIDCKLTQPKLSSLENGESTITPELIVLYSNFFSVTSDYILKGIHRPNMEHEKLPTDTLPLHNTLIYENYGHCDFVECLEEELDDIDHCFLSQDWPTPFAFIKSIFEYIKSKGRWQFILIFLLGISIMPFLPEAVFISFPFWIFIIGHALMASSMFHERQKILDRRQDILDALEQMKNSKEE